jgi:signal transduction histidine kinase/CheY-like chemotaxis protein
MENAARFFDLIHPDDVEPARKSIAESARTMSPWRAEFRMRHPAKGEFWVEAQSTPEVQPDGSVLWHGFMSDATERRRVAAQRLLAKEAADSANRAKSEFLAMMSHEIRTPMNGLIGFADLLRQTSLTAEQSEFVQIIHQSGYALLTLINDIIDFSKIEAGKLALESIPYNFPRVVADVAELLSVQIGQKDLSIRVHCEPSAPAEFRGDPGRARQVLLNLAGNAVKFTKRGSVTITLLADQERARFLRCEISDTGIGIPADKQSKLFQLFSQADSSTTRRFGGTGLGLAISKRLVELMGGEIGLSSEVNKGSTFWFTLPAGDPSPGQIYGLENTVPAALAPPAVASLPMAAVNYRVLLAEDNETNQRLAVHVLEKLGCRVDVVPNGLEAVALAGRSRYDLILMDCLMPEMDGLEATREIRRAEHGPGRVPIVALTASVIDGRREKCLAAGMDDFVEKPIHGDKLARALRKWAGAGSISAPNVTNLS